MFSVSPQLSTWSFYWHRESKKRSSSSSFSQNVQKLSTAAEEPVPAYFVKGGSVGPVESFPIAQTPIVDLSLLRSVSSKCSGKEQEDELEKLKSALSEWGCFQAIGHGIPTSFLDEFRGIAKEFFALPVEEKQKYARDPADLQGHGADPILSNEQVLDWSKRLFLKLLALDSRKLKLWPETTAEFRELLGEYFKEVKSVIDLLQKAMARSLDMEENCFSKKYGDRAFMAARFNHYPPCSIPDFVLGAKAHSDGSGTTVLLQDEEVEGRQVLKDDQWFRVPIVPGAFVVNVGDQMQIMSNGIFKSPPHRVTANAQNERISVAVFYFPDTKTEVEPNEGSISEERPQMYKKLENYAAINFECFQSGKTALDAVRL
ncbi:hypothetical protein BT93_L4737 [Corymbia citriodora subsp. variegata]|uniref:Fe2OG dioxygenase domain-containing protein n=1 Tax=Corymbia citriodora subsp. variegata TaxID=360336 RepID=A0A8T0CW66_CORYI|nr:hypothetical protein BT93_L4737 [Corymbia citriodora subsp. variegata]